MLVRLYCWTWDRLCWYFGEEEKRERLRRACSKRI
jgi:hypothetical protein